MKNISYKLIVISLTMVSMRAMEKSLNIPGLSLGADGKMHLVPMPNSLTNLSAADKADIAAEIVASKITESYDSNSTPRTAVPVKAKNTLRTLNPAQREAIRAALGTLD